MSALQKSLQRGKFPPVPPISNSSEGDLGRRYGRKRNYTPVPWDKYFDTKVDVRIDEKNVFRVYRTGNTGPLLVLLHGGGYSGLTWALVGPSVIKLVDCQVLALDLRGHGSTVTDNDEDLSAEIMSKDVSLVIKEMFPEEIPPIILVGHSMGGAVAVHVAFHNLIPSVIGLIVIDVVEGTALDALQSMQSFLRSRPASFRSIENAIEWCIRSGQVRNLESAKVSMPGQIKKVGSNILATECMKDCISMESQGDTHHTLSRENSIPEEAEEDEDALGEEGRHVEQSPKKTKSDDGFFKMPNFPTVESDKYTWRIDLSKTEKYWTGWFQGLSNMFLNCSPAKMLLLAGVDRLDKDLTIGQMQGKFQMQVLPQCGHAVHEDVPDKVSEVIASFLVRNKFVQPTGTFHMVLPGC